MTTTTNTTLFTDCGCPRDKRTKRPPYRYKGHAKECEDKKFKNLLNVPPPTTAYETFIEGMEGYKMKANDDGVTASFVYTPKSFPDFSKPFNCECSRCKKIYTQQLPGLVRCIENYRHVCDKCADEWGTIKAKAFYDYWPDNPDFKDKE